MEPITIWLRRATWCALLVVLVAFSDVDAVPFQNGSFEAGTTGWTFANNGGSAAVNTTQGKTQGTQATQFNGGQAGPGATVSQTFDTVVGQFYNLKFDYGGFGTPSRNLTLDLDVTGASNLIAQSIATDTAGANNVTVWDRYSVQFQADSTSTTLTFRDTTTVANSNSADSNLDNVQLTLVTPTVSPGGDGVLGTVNYVGGNLALAGTASQSTTRAAGGAAGRAIDGNTNGNFGANSTTHTDAGDPAPTWQVDLGGGPNDTFAIEQVVIFNRSDCCQSRLVDFDVNVLNGQTGVNDLNTFDFGNPSGGNVNGDGVADNNANAVQSHGRQGLGVFFAPNTVGEVVQIAQNNNITLSLAEVQVFGAADFDLTKDEMLAIDLGSMGNDFVNVEQSANLDGILKLVSQAGFSPAGTQSFDVLTASDISLGQNYVVDTSMLLGLFRVDSEIISGGNGQILRITTTALPEPTTLVLLTVGVAGLVRRRRAGN